MSALKSYYEILPEYNLVIEFHRGILKAIDYIEFKKTLLKDPKFKANLNHFIHFKNVTFNTTPTDISEFVSFMEKKSHSLGFRKVVLVTNTPNQVVSTTMYKMMLQNPNQSIEICSTNKKALKWLKIANSEFDSIINLLIEFDKK